ncbi:hypothetical protein B0H11DRAFT_1991901 [Mycena galericulata]|nr:hypothetical protein B0H11DRAFT_1991901 [Mycena galericulata]
MVDIVIQAIHKKITVLQSCSLNRLVNLRHDAASKDVAVCFKIEILPDVRGVHDKLLGLRIFHHHHNSIPVLSYSVVNKCRPRFRVAKGPNVVVKHMIMLPHFESHKMLLDCGNAEKIVDEVFELLVMLRGGDTRRDVVHAYHVHTVPGDGVVVFGHDLSRKARTIAMQSEFFAFFDYLLNLRSSQQREQMIHSLTMHRDEDNRLSRRESKCFDMFIHQVLLEDNLYFEHVFLHQRKLKNLINEGLEFCLEFMLREVRRDLVNDHGVERVLACGRRHRSGEMA